MKVNNNTWNSKPNLREGIHKSNSIYLPVRGLTTSPLFLEFERISYTIQLIIR